MRIAKFPDRFIGMNFHDAVQITFKSQQKKVQENEADGKVSPNKLENESKVMKLILFGVIQEEKEEQLFTHSLINPGGEYIIQETDKAYIFLRMIGEYVTATDELVDKTYESQVNQYI